MALYPPSISGALHEDSNHHHHHDDDEDKNPDGNVVEKHEKHENENGYSVTGSEVEDESNQNENEVKETEPKVEQKLRLGKFKIHLSKYIYVLKSCSIILLIIIIEGKLLEDAVSALIRFLTDRRQKISKILKSQNHVNGNFEKLLGFAELVDTTLLKSYMVINESLVGPLLRVPNHCNVEESEGLLFDRKVYQIY